MSPVQDVEVEDEPEPNLSPPAKEEIAATTPPSSQEQDAEQQALAPPLAPKESAFKSLGLLDRFLALWILLSMAVGILLGNFVPSVGPALQRGTFVGVSIPIGAFDLCGGPGSAIRSVRKKIQC